MKMLDFSKGLLAVAVLLASFTSKAAVFDLGTLPDNTITPIGNSAEALGNTDTWNFSLAEATDFEFFLIDIGPSEYFGYTLTELSTNTVLEQGSANSLPVYGGPGATVFSLQLLPGDYALDIVNAYVLYDGGYSGQMWTGVVPLPSAAWLMLSGLVGLGSGIRRRRPSVQG